MIFCAGVKMNEPRVAIIDYEMCNLFSVTRACHKAGLIPVITRDPDEIDAADAVILPGVGAFGDAMKNLKQLDLIPVLERASRNKPFMGICLGLQLLFSSSTEFGDHTGLNLIEGVVEKFPNEMNGRKIKVPQVGWNRISFAPSEPVFAGVPNGSFFYFVHSYYVNPVNRAQVLSCTDYEGIDYCSSIKKDNVIAFQFHPEKSGVLGLKIYENWKQMIKAGRI
jgi:imidazole glycerol-phosphate synthase subunit HisH